MKLCQLLVFLVYATNAYRVQIWFHLFLTWALEDMNSFSLRPHYLHARNRRLRVSQRRSCWCGGQKNFPLLGTEPGIRASVPATLSKLSLIDHWRSDAVWDRPMRGDKAETFLQSVNSFGLVWSFYLQHTPKFILGKCNRVKHTKYPFLFCYSWTAWTLRKEALRSFENSRNTRRTGVTIEGRNPAFH